MQGEEGTHKGESVHVRVGSDIYPQILARNQSRNDPEGVERNAQDGDDVWVRQMFSLDTSVGFDNGASMGR